MNHTLKKNELRKQYLAKRMELSPDAYADLNAKLVLQFQKLDLIAVKCISLFLPMLERREPDTFLLVEWLKENRPDIKLAFPRSNFGDHSMQHFLEDITLQIDTNDYGIPEPVSGTEIGVEEIDMVIVPLLCFDKKGYRVGYGKGFYDRFMAACKAGTEFIGLSFFEPTDSIDDLNEYDMALHQCITPDVIFSFS